jgi:hypothetical protein
MIGAIRLAPIAPHAIEPLQGECPRRRMRVEAPGDRAMTSRRDDRDLMRPEPGTRQDPTYDDPPPRRSGYQRQTVIEAAIKSFIRSIGSSLGRILMRSLTGRGRR